MSRHEFDPLSDFCMGCGLAVREAMEANTMATVCPQDNHTAYLKARHRMSLVIDPVLERLGFKEPETKQ